VQPEYKRTERCLLLAGSKENSGIIYNAVSFPSKEGVGLLLGSLYMFI
jgi:hypothetical protein